MPGAWTSAPGAEAARRTGRRLQRRPRHRQSAGRGRAPTSGHGNNRLPGPAHKARHQSRNQPSRRPRDSPPGPAANTERTTGPVLWADRYAALHWPSHRLHRAENRLRRRHHQGAARRRGTDTGHRPGLTDLPAAHQQSPQRPRPRLRLPRLHHLGDLVRGTPHHLLVTRRSHHERKRNTALIPSPPRDTQGKLDHEAAHRNPLVHPATTPRPPPTATTQPLLQPRQPHHGRMTPAGRRRGLHGRELRRVSSGTVSYNN